MNEDEPAASLHHAISRDRGVDAAGNQRHEPAAGADGQAAGAGDFVKTEECVARKYFDGDGKLEMR